MKTSWDGNFPGYKVNLVRRLLRFIDPGQTPGKKRIVDLHEESWTCKLSVAALLFIALFPFPLRAETVVSLIKDIYHLDMKKIRDKQLVYFREHGANLA